MVPYFSNPPIFVDSMVRLQCGEVIYDGLAGLWQTGLFYDVEVCVGCMKLQCHKVILSAHSAVFQAMFTNQMREASSGRVQLSSHSPPVFRSVLEFMYKGTVGTVTIYKKHNVSCFWKCLDNHRLLMAL